MQIYVQPVTAAGQPPAPTILAGEALADPVTGKYSVTVGQYVGQQPTGALTSLADGSYNVTAIQYDVAGNPSQAVLFGNTGAVVIDGTDSPNHGDNLGPGGANELGWRYMQTVLNVIEPNISRTTKTFVVLGCIRARWQRHSYVTPAISSAFAQSNLKRDGWNIVFVEGTSQPANIDTYLSGGQRPGDRLEGCNSLGTISLAQTGFIFIVTANHLADDLNDAEIGRWSISTPWTSRISSTRAGACMLSMKRRAVGANTAGPLRLASDGLPGPPGGPGSGGARTGLWSRRPDSTIFPSLTAADFTGSQWHNYFTGNFAGLGLAIAVTAIPGSGGFGGFGGGGWRWRWRGVRARVLGSRTAGAGVERWGCNDEPVADRRGHGGSVSIRPSIALDPSTDTGASKSDNITQNNNSSRYPAPVFDVLNPEDGTTVQLFRTPVDASAHQPTGPAVLVNTLTNEFMGNVGIPDINQSNPALQTPGPVIPDGTYLYTVQLTDLAGNASPVGSGLIVTIDSVTPVHALPSRSSSPTRVRSPTTT